MVATSSCLSKGGNLIGQSHGHSSQLSADVKNHNSSYPHFLQKPVTRKQARRSRKQKGASPQRIRPRTVERRRGGRLAKDCLSAEWAPEIPRSRSLSPLRASFHGNTQRLAQLSLGSYGSSQSSWDKSTSSEPPHQHASRLHQCLLYIQSIIL